MLSKCSGATLALAAVACSGDAGRSRAEDTTAQANNPSSGSSYGAPGGALEGTPATPAGGMTGESPESSMSPYLSVSEGWVDGASNAYGIQGAFFTYQDGTGRTTIMNDAAESQVGYCVSGSSAEVLDGNFSGTWGAVAALNLSQEVGSVTAGSYDAALHGVVGFGFEIVGDTGGALRFVVKQFAVHDGFCINNVPDCALGCSVAYRFDELTQNCWLPGGALPNAGSLQALEWQIVTKAGAATPFDYCIENIQVTLEPAGPEESSSASPY